MATCFVMQPFDGGTFDKRYESVFKPAVEAAGLEPYRVDRDPGTAIPIEDIENGIREAEMCLAEITLDNPNVWFELGYAIACSKPVVLVCSSERSTRFPFDIQHRSVIKYDTGAPQDYDQLKNAITSKIVALRQKAETLAVASSTKVAEIEGLDTHEIVCLATIAANLTHPEDHVSAWLIKRDMEHSGSTKVAATIAMKSLVQKGLLVAGSYDDPVDNDTYTGYCFTEAGWSWVIANKSRFKLSTEPKPEPDFNDDIPF